MKNIDYLEAMEIGQNTHFIGVNDKYNKNNISTVKMEIAELLENGEISVESLKKLVPPNVPNTFIPTKTISSVSFILFHKKRVNHFSRGIATTQCID